MRDYLNSGAVDMPEGVILEQTIIALGDVVFIPFPFEVFSEIVMRLREYSPYRHTLSLSNTNGSKGYLPTQDQLCRGGYEVMNFSYRDVFSLAEDTDRHLINENLRIIREGRNSGNRE